MTTQIIATFNQDDDYQKVLTITPGKFTTAHWAETLSIEEQQEWSRQNSIHQDTVQAAVAAGDAEVHNATTTGNATIKWRNEEIHSYWMKTISVEDHASYLRFWARYYIAAGDRK